jgi:hypothetical protein
VCCGQLSLQHESLGTERVDCKPSFLSVTCRPTVHMRSMSCMFGTRFLPQCVVSAGHVAALLSMQRCRRYWNLKPRGRSSLVLYVLMKRETMTAQTVRICASKSPEHTTNTRHRCCCRDRPAHRQSDRREAVSSGATTHPLAYQLNSINRTENSSQH